MIKILFELFRFFRLYYRKFFVQDLALDAVTRSIEVNLTPLKSNPSFSYSEFPTENHREIPPQRDEAR